jgi:cobalt-zinc-cadmium efflux system membrane fusion protein
MHLNDKSKICLGMLMLICSNLFLTSCEEKKEKKETVVTISDSLIKNMNIGVAKIMQVRSELMLTGKVIADQSKQIQVYPLVGGIVSSLNVELGDYVEAGQVLAVIRSGEAADFGNQYVTAKSNLQIAKKSMQVAEDMFNSKLLSEREFLQAQQDLKKAESELNKSEEVQKIYSVSNKSDYVIKAPMSGFVIEKNINKDMQVRSDNSGSILTISGLKDVWIMANVYENDIEKVKEKDTVSVSTIAYPDKIFKAFIDKVNNVLDPQSRVMKVRIKLDNPNYLLKPEMYANVTVYYAEPVKMITIPASALVFDNSNNYVLIYKGERNFKVQKVELYKTIGKKAYIISGIKENENVITKNQLLIYNALTNN